MKARRKWAAGVATGVLIGTLTGIVLAAGAWALGWLWSSDAPPVSASVEELGSECGSKTFLPADRARATLRRGIDGFVDWERFQSQPDAAFAEYDMVQVSIQGESARKVTLTGIEFEVERRPRPAGAIFLAPCGGPLIGRGFEVDVEAAPPRVLVSSAGPEAELGPGGTLNRDLRPIAFPWTVSLTDPLLLYVVATARSCYCVWRAEIPWESGGERGTIAIDDAGSGFVVVGREGVPSYTISGEGWTS